MRPPRRAVGLHLARAVGELAGLALPSRCVGCGEPGPSWCRTCADDLAELDQGAWWVEGGPDLRCAAGAPAGWDDGGPAASRLTSRDISAGASPEGLHGAPPDASPEGLRGAPPDASPDGLGNAPLDAPWDDAAGSVIPVVAAVPYAGVVRTALHAFKDSGRRDAVAVLAPLMGAALIEAVTYAGGTGPVFVVPAPSSPASVRRRGDVPTHLLVRRALAGVEVMTGREVVWAPVLRHVRRVSDQAGLGRRERAHNVHGAFGPAGPLCIPPDSPVVVADDVVTTGATTRECARVLRDSGARRILVAAMAATPDPGPRACVQPRRDTFG